MSTILVTIPARLGGDLQIAVPVEDDGQPGDVLVRPAYSSQRWERLVAVGGTVEVRP